MNYNKIRILGYFTYSAEHSETVGFYTTFFMPFREPREMRELVRDALDKRISRHGLSLVQSGAFRTFCMVETIAVVAFSPDEVPPPTDGFSLFRMRRRAALAAMQAAWHRTFHSGLVLR